MVQLLQLHQLDYGQARISICELQKEFNARWYDHSVVISVYEDKSFTLLLQRHHTLLLCF